MYILFNGLIHMLCSPVLGCCISLMIKTVENKFGYVPGFSVPISLLLELADSVLTV